MKYRMYILTVLLLLTVMFTGCGTKDTDEVTGVTWTEGLPESPPLAVNALEVVTGRLMPFVEAGGVVEGVQEAVVVSQTQGIILAAYAEIGNEVEKGTPLLKVDDAIAAINLEQARGQLENSRIILEAQEKLRAGGGVSQAELLRSRSAFQGAQSFYESALKTFENTNLKSPLKGVLAWKTSNLEVGNYLSPGQVLYRVADLSSIKITLSVGERQIGLIKPGARAIITIPSAMGTAVLEGIVSAVGAGSDLSTGSYKVIVEAANPAESGIKAGMTAGVKIFTDDPRQGIIIPRSAVVNREGNSYVFVEEKGVAVTRAVQTGDSLGNRLIVSQGLEEGLTIITSGLSALKPGDPVKTRLLGNSEEGV